MGASMSMDVHSEGAVELKQKRPRTSGRFLYPLRLATGDLFSLAGDPASLGGDNLLYRGVRQHSIPRPVYHATTIDKPKGIPRSK